MHLHAGPLTLDLDNGDLRCIRLGDTEIIRRIYMVFQDRNWTSRPWILQDVSVDQQPDAFTAHFTAHGTFDARSFVWECRIEGGPDGTISYAVSGRTSDPFLRNRLGLCVLHPMSLAGAAVRIEHASGGVEQSRFPEAISPHQPFLDIAAMTHEALPGVQARLELRGEVFETEDHRNWSDASFKTYCTPIERPFPMLVQPDGQFEQSALLTLTGAPRVTTTPSDVIEIEVFDATAPLPRIGLQTNAEPMTDAHLDALRALELDHLRVDIDAGSDSASAERALHDAAMTARALGCSLHAAVFDAGTGALERLSQTDHELGGIVSRWIIFRSDEKVTSRRWTDEARAVLGPAAIIGGGTNLYFTELNRQPPDTSDLDVVNFSMNPQVHSFDDRTVLQNAATAMVIAQNAPRLAGDALVSVAPITLRPRFNPNATDPDADVSNDHLPASVDQRQPTWFAAAWTALSIGYLAGPGTVDSVTYFETTGPRGILDAHSAEPCPVHALLAELAGHSRVRLCASSDPEVCDALLLERPSGLRAIIVNMSDRSRDVHLTGTVDERISAAPHGLTLIDLPRRMP